MLCIGFSVCSRADRVTPRGWYLRVVTSDQCRAARALLRWTHAQLAEHADVSKTAIYEFEADRRTPHRSTIKALQTAFEAAGVRFLNNGEGPGVRLVKKPSRDSAPASNGNDTSE